MSEYTRQEWNWRERSYRAVAVFKEIQDSGLKEGGWQCGWREVGGFESDIRGRINKAW